MSKLGYVIIRFSDGTKITITESQTFVLPSSGPKPISIELGGVDVIGWVAIVGAGGGAGVPGGAQNNL